MGRVVKRLWPASVQSVGAMRGDRHLQIKAVCSRCRGSFKVNLELLEQAFGRRYSLMDRRGICPVHGCEGSCVFLVRFGDSQPFVPLKDL